MLHVLLHVATLISDDYIPSIKGIVPFILNNKKRPVKRLRRKNVVVKSKSKQRRSEIENYNNFMIHLILLLIILFIYVLVVNIFKLLVECSVCHEPRSVLAGLFTSKRPLQRDTNGVIFLDLDPVAFGHILAWLRTRVVPRDLPLDQQSVLLETAKQLHLDVLRSDLSSPIALKKKNVPLTQAELLYHVTSYAFKKYPIQLCGAKLSGLCLSTLDLSGANLRNAVLVGADLSAVNLARADLLGTNFTGATLGGANLTGANLVSVNLTGANLQSADLQGASLWDVVLKDVNFRGANLSGINLSDENLTDVKLIRANLTGAILIGTNFTRANLRSANLSNANLHRTILEDANLSNANLTGADLSYANLKDANLKGANLKDACLEDSNREGANREDANINLEQAPEQQDTPKKLLDENSVLKKTSGAAVRTHESCERPSHTLACRMRRRCWRRCSRSSLRTTSRHSKSSWLRTRDSAMRCVVAAGFKVIIVFRTIVS